MWKASKQNWMPHTFSFGIAETGRAGFCPSEATPVPPEGAVCAPGTVSESAKMAAPPSIAALRMSAPAARGVEGNNGTSSSEAIALGGALVVIVDFAWDVVPDTDMAPAQTDVLRPLPRPLPRLDARDICFAPPALQPRPSPPVEGSISSPSFAVSPTRAIPSASVLKTGLLWINGTSESESLSPSASVLKTGLLWFNGTSWSESESESGLADFVRLAGLCEADALQPLPLPPLLPLSGLAPRFVSVAIAAALASGSAAERG